MPIRPPTVTRTPSLGADRYAYVTNAGSQRFRIVLTGEAVERMRAAGSIDSEAAKIVTAELRRLRAAIESSVRGHAPDGLPATVDRYGNARGRNEKLHDTIRGQVVQNTIILRMAWWGFINLEGRGPMGKDGGTFAIPQPDGSVIFRRRVGGARPNPFLQRADRDLHRSGAYESTMQVITERIAALIGAMDGARGRLGFLPAGDTEGGRAFYSRMRGAARPNKATRARQKDAFEQASRTSRRKGQVLHSRRTNRVRALNKGVAKRELERKRQSIKKHLMDAKELERLDLEIARVKTRASMGKISRQEAIAKMVKLRTQEKRIEERLKAALGPDWSSAIATRAHSYITGAMDAGILNKGSGFGIERKGGSTKYRKKTPTKKYRKRRK